MLKYVNFEVKIERRRGREYDVSVSSPPAGEASGTFILPFTPKRLKDIRETIEIALVRSMMPVRRVVPPEFEKLRDFGHELYSALFKNAVKSCYDRSFSVAFREGKGLRLKLHLDPTLTNLPWEFMYSQEMRDYLALCRPIPPVRYNELPQPVIPLEVALPLRILVVIASPSDYTPLNVEREKERITSALRELQERGILKVEFLEGKNTLTALHRRLRQADYHVLHFIGHGDYDEEEEEGLLLMEDARGRGRSVSGQWLGRLLRGYFPMRLVVLNACEGALTSSSDPFAGVAAAVVGVGVPAVVAMQFEITDEAAVIFSREFYSALADNYPVDAAVTEARMAIVHSRRNTIEWATPVLYMRAPDGILFTLQELPERKPAEKRLVALYAQAKALFENKNWSETIARCEEILAITPSYRDADDLLSEAKKGLARQEKEERLVHLYGEAMECFESSNWQEAIVKLQLVLDLEVGYRDAADRLADAQEKLAKAEAEKKRKKLAARYKQAVAAIKSSPRLMRAIVGAALLVALVGILTTKLWQWVAMPTPTAVATTTATLPVATQTPRPTATSLPPTSTAVVIVPPVATPTETPAATATRTQTPTPTATRTQTPTPTTTRTQTPAATATRTQTPTPTATRVGAPIPTPTTTPKPTAIPTGTATQTPIPVPTIKLLKPDNDAHVSGPVTFNWEWPGEFGPGEIFDVKVCKGEDCQPKFGKTNTYGTSWQWCPDAGGGVYRWRVEVIDDTTKQPKGPTSEIRKFTWEGNGACKPKATATPTPVPPTATPTSSPYP